MFPLPIVIFATAFIALLGACDGASYPTGPIADSSATDVNTNVTVNPPNFSVISMGRSSIAVESITFCAPAGVDPDPQVEITPTIVSLLLSDNGILEPYKDGICPDRHRIVWHLDLVIQSGLGTGTANFQVFPKSNPGSFETFSVKVSF